MTIKNITSSVSGRETGLGDVSRSLQNAFRHTNFNSGGPLTLPNQNGQPMVFITRPNLNLTYHNMLQDTRLESYLAGNSQPLNINHAIRCQLGTRLNRMALGAGDFLEEQIKSPLVDPFSPWMPILTNNLISLTGWPDNTLDFFTSKEGRVKQVWSYPEGVSRYNKEFTLTANFRNLEGDPVSRLFYLWIIYMASVHSETMYSDVDSLIYDTLEYSTRIYVLVPDALKRKVNYIACTELYAYPAADSMGSIFNFDTSKATNTENRDISVNFQCVGANYNDPLTVMAFNEAVQLFNPLMRPVKEDVEEDTLLIGEQYGMMYKLQPKDYPILRDRSMMRINPLTMELEYYINRDDLKSEEFIVSKFGV